MGAGEYAILYYLILHEGEGISAERLYEKVRQLPMGGNANAVKTAVSRLRKRLEGSGYTIASGWGTGYCFERENAKNGCKLATFLFLPVAYGIMCVGLSRPSKTGSHGCGFLFLYAMEQN